MRVVTERGFTLEPQFAAHAPAMFELLSDAAIYEFENEPPASVAALRQRFKRLESRRSPDGSQQWLNWVIRLHSGDVAGYVQATVHGDGRAALAYVLGSRYWGKGIATRAVRAMIGELRAKHGVNDCIAIIKSRNARSSRLLQRLGFLGAGPETRAIALEDDERLFVLRANPSSR
ncbi:GNAT family N-acetyltransferase [Ramlibacter sp. PS4R-6]|uniref:GNAT family N-acetyltransferase n=1 Tax=Ramlibacter sp. PS4R-6 TaxID=3133438 RepID=UPI0030B610A6